MAVESFSGDPLEASDNAQYLREAVEKVAGPVRLHFIAGAAPVMVEASGYKALLVPLREAS